VSGGGKGLKYTWRGHPIEKVGETEEGDIWVYSDTKVAVSQDPNRDCGFCGLSNNEEGHDACLGTLPGVKNACCGHGSGHAYIQYENGRTLRDTEALQTMALHRVNGARGRGVAKPSSNRKNRKTMGGHNWSRFKDDTWRLHLGGYELAVQGRGPLHNPESYGWTLIYKGRVQAGGPAKTLAEAKKAVYLRYCHIPAS